MEKIRRPIDITFEDIVYSVPVSKKRGKFYIVIHILYTLHHFIVTLYL